MFNKRKKAAGKMVDLPDDRDDGPEDAPADEGLALQRRKERAAKESIFSAGHTAQEGTGYLYSGEGGKLDLAELAGRLRW